MMQTIDYVKKGGTAMATSSITHNFVISSPESIEKFVTALEEAEHDRSSRKILPGRQLTDSDEILTLMKKRNKENV